MRWWHESLALLPGTTQPIVGWVAIYQMCRELGLTRLGSGHYKLAAWQELMRAATPSPIARIHGRQPHVVTCLAALWAWLLSGAFAQHLRLRRRRR